MTTQKRNPIRLSDYGMKVRDLGNLKAELLSRLRPIIFQLDSIQDLHFEILKHLKPINKTVRNNPASIKRHAEKVLDHFGILDLKGSITKLNSDGSSETKEVEYDNFEQFQTVIIGFATTPKSELHFLKHRVEGHLKGINNLVNYYEELDIVKDQINRNHEAKTILDFYERNDFDWLI